MISETLVKKSTEYPRMAIMQKRKKEKINRKETQ